MKKALIALVILGVIGGSIYYKFQEEKKHVNEIEKEKANIEKLLEYSRKLNKKVEEDLKMMEEFRKTNNIQQATKHAEESKTKSEELRKDFENSLEK